MAFGETPSHAEFSDTEHGEKNHAPHPIVGIPFISINFHHTTTKR
jgi:hypothetical protein